MPVKYELMSHDESYHDNHWAIKILEGDLEGVVFQYDTVKFREEDGQGILDFEVLDIEKGEKVDTNDQTTSDILGGILVDIIEQQMREMENGDGNTDIEASA
jgi:hypothetical protein